MTAPNIFGTKNHTHKDLKDTTANTQAPEATLSISQVTELTISKRLKN
jgi:hypothetical protein